MSKKIASILASFVLFFSLTSCGSSTPIILESDEDCSEKMTISDLTVDSVYNPKEGGASITTSGNDSSLTFHFTVKNDSPCITTSLCYDFNIADSTGKNVLLSPISEYSKMLILYPGDSSTIKKTVSPSDTYQFTTLETYKITDFKVTKTPAYSSNAIYSTELDPTNDKYITVTDLLVRYVNDLSGTNLYRVDYKMSYILNNKDNKTIWFYYPQVILHMDGKEFVLSENSRSYEENALQSCYYFNSTETLDLEKPYTLSIKACIGTKDYNPGSSVTTIVLTIMICSVAAPVVAAIIVLIVMLSINKKNKKKKEQQ